MLARRAVGRGLVARIAAPAVAALIGGFILGILECMVNLWSAQWREVAIFVLVIGVLAFKPNGLFGQKLVEKV